VASCVWDGEAGEGVGAVGEGVVAGAGLPRGDISTMFSCGGGGCWMGLYVEPLAKTGVSVVAGCCFCCDRGGTGTGEVGLRAGGGFVTLEGLGVVVVGWWAGG